MAETTEIRPQAGRQTEFLSSSADIVIYGGAAGGGKTYALLMEPLRHVHNPRFGAVIFRRTTPEITKEGGLWDEAMGLYALLGATPNQVEHQFTFEGGSRVTFAHLQYETTLDSWKSAQIPLIEFDQLETFSQRQFFYMLSRNRSTCGARPYVRATANPEPGWLAEFLGWWIAEDGCADLERVGAIRWFVRGSDDQLVWADSADELVKSHPGSEPKSVTFIVSTIHDNQILMTKDPGYLANLKALPLIDRERLLGDARRGGNWKVKPAAGKVFNRAWFDIVPMAKAGGISCRFFDFAGTEKKSAKQDPDYTASVLIRRVDGEYYVMDCTAAQIGPAEVDRVFKNTASQDAARCKAEGSEYRLRWEEEPGSAGKRESHRLVKMVAGINARGVPPRGDKLLRAKPFASQAEAGNVHLVQGAWNEMLLEHLHAQPEWPHDDIMDACSGADEEIASPDIAGFYARKAAEIRTPANG
jgi:predicted phage terminase large subunit-like protein